MPSRHSIAFSLTEVLIVIAILAIVAALLFPVVSGGRQRGRIGAEITQLRQLGAAHALYTEQFGEPALEVRRLVAAGLVPKALAVSPADPTVAGVGNECFGILARMGPNVFDARIHYPYSYVGLRERTVDRLIPLYVRVLTDEATGGGWLVSLIGTDYSSTNCFPSKGVFRRLRFDGGVTIRQSGEGTTQFEGGSTVLFMYGDFTREWMQSYVTHGLPES